MSCQEISADWAAQRIKGLSLGSAIWNALLPPRKPKDRKHVIKTLIDSFRYPRQGPGMMWEACAAKIRDRAATFCWAEGHRLPLSTPTSNVVDCDRHATPSGQADSILRRARHLLRADARTGRAASSRDAFRRCDRAASRCATATS